MVNMRIGTLVQEYAVEHSAVVVRKMSATGSVLVWHYRLGRPEHKTLVWHSTTAFLKREGSIYGLPIGDIMAMYALARQSAVELPEFNEELSYTVDLALRADARETLTRWGFEVDPIVGQFPAWDVRVLTPST